MVVRLVVVNSGGGIHGGSGGSGVVRGIGDSGGGSDLDN